MRKPDLFKSPRWRDTYTWMFSVCGVLMIAGLILTSGPGSNRPDPVPFDRADSITQLIDEAEHGKVESITYYDSTDEVLAVLRDRPNLLVPIPEVYADTFLSTMVKDDVEVAQGSGTPQRPVAPSNADHNGIYVLGLLLFATGLGGLLITSVLYAAHRRARAANAAAAAAAAQDSPAAAATPTSVPATRFADVAGADEAVEDLAEMVDFLRAPDRYTRLGAKPPKGALLVGPPGTGKTLLARAVAGEAGVPFFQMAGSDFVEKYVGVGAQRIRDLFKKARDHDRAIIFIDEIDAIGRRRSDGNDHGNNGESENTLIALLAELDGFTSRGNILVLAATNRPDILDPAVTRPGRLDRRVEVPNPDRRGREKILAVHAQGRPLAADVDLTHVARRTPGFSGAQMEAIVNEACMEGARRDLDTVTAECFDFAIATVAMGRARTSALVTEHDRTVTAWHEAGHTLAAFLIPEADDPVQVTIVPRGPAGGVTWMGGSDDIFLSRRKAHAQLVVALGGRAGEELYLDGEYTQGASGDLNSATDTATRMVAQYGMSRLGYRVRSNPNSTEVGEVVEEMLHDAHERAYALLAKHRDFLAAVAARLLDEETLTYAQIAEIGAELGVDVGTEVPLPDIPRPVRTDPAPPPVESGVVVPLPVRDPAPTARPGAVRGLAARLRGRHKEPRPTATAGA